MSISISLARTIIGAALAKGQSAQMKPLSVIVVDTGGFPVAFERADGASPGRFAIAHGKAQGCIMLGLPGSAIQTRAEAQPTFINAMNGLFSGAFVPVKGGVLVRDAHGTIIGAVGITGDTSDNDALAAVAGIQAAGLVAEA